ncbi:MAG: hypothetical protein EAZ32_00835 [Cytophagia bacterium]|nr:MAG: hypothetical protein EAZ46_13150 [Runella sp.]TAG23423.1 MAG: hypothetical protein EAZ38_03340 [Cytophagales bacterium]TAG42610.1 MAG: hypothetical protein EAZ32_00835 [Cytophagia bacterium]TAG58611.1 MAG: hypothetical protein EAZ29_00680 [Runella slithyformis]TAG76299.1 MAG: hypothetical protein EAZ22_18490 [Cytophagales bacterium]
MEHYYPESNKNNIGGQNAIAPIQCNNTEREIVDELLANGVPKSDIVLGFMPPHARHFSGFAVA